MARRHAATVWSFSAALAFAGAGALWTAHAQDGEREPLQDFREGNVTLGCHVPCSGTFGWNRRKLKQFHDNGQWHELASEVSRIGFGGDLAHYYLGRAAEGLGYDRVAVTYYQRALSAPKCAGLINVCDGFNVPELARERSATLLGDR